MVMSHGCGRCSLLLLLMMGSPPKVAAAAAECGDLVHEGLLQLPEVGAAPSSDDDPVLLAEQEGRGRHGVVGHGQGAAMEAAIAKNMMVVRRGRMP
jgi:hypothetical protein